MMTVLAGAVTCCSAALADAGIDTVGLVTGGVAAVVRDEEAAVRGKTMSVLDPCPAEHHGEVVAAAVVAYVEARDEVVEVWMKGMAGDAEQTEGLVDRAVQAAAATRGVLEDAVRENLSMKFPDLAEAAGGRDVEMEG